LIFLEIGEKSMPNLKEHHRLWLILPTGVEETRQININLHQNGNLISREGKCHFIVLSISNYIPIPINFFSFP